MIQTGHRNKSQFRFAICTDVDTLAFNCGLVWYEKVSFANDAAGLFRMFPIVSCEFTEGALIMESEDGKGLKQNNDAVS